MTRKSFFKRANKAQQCVYKTHEESLADAWEKYYERIDGVTCIVCSNWRCLDVHLSWTGKTVRHKTPAGEFSTTRRYRVIEVR